MTAIIVTIAITFLLIFILWILVTLQGEKRRNVMRLIFLFWIISTLWGVIALLVFGR